MNRKQLLAAAVAVMIGVSHGSEGSSSPTMMSSAPTMVTSMPSSSPTMDTSEPTSQSAMPTAAPTRACTVEDETPLINTGIGETPYVVGWFGEDADVFNFQRTDVDGYILWPYALGKCTALGPINQEFGIFTCEDENVVLKKWTRETSGVCEGDEDDMVTIPQSAFAQTQGAFTVKCDGDGDSYVALDFSAGVSDCESDSPAYGVVGVCGVSRMFPDFDYPAAAQMYCDKDGAVLEFFQASNRENQCATDADLCQRMVIDENCVKLFSTEAADVYGKINDCESAEKDASREDGSSNGTGDDGSAHALSLLVVALLSIVAAAML